MLRTHGYFLVFSFADERKQSHASGKEVSVPSNLVGNPQPKKGSDLRGKGVGPCVIYFLQIKMKFFEWSTTIF